MEDRSVSIFVDPTGEVCFATLEDVMIDPTSDVRVEMIHKLANGHDWPHNFWFPDGIVGVHPSLNELARHVIVGLKLEN